ncbi:hypothetical protein [Sphaerimonospora thailandensis]|uniref:Uncharacterized protein n=1 Tax=Sphaerimonospora thailandensis TaxID=795644 RepID=A0A8J3RBD4_9ACTN|nr:hypothetical protein [Sphaerimonospora thailandensis]GIH69418.1 hypothetical protein Mth01_16710 [Sphaerimonospora thailandensis]
MNLQDLIQQYGSDWVIRPGRAGGDPSATRRKQLPASALRGTALSMTVFASDLTELARKLADQTAEAERTAGRGA